MYWWARYLLVTHSGVISIGKRKKGKRLSPQSLHLIQACLPITGTYQPKNFHSVNQLNRSSLFLSLSLQKWNTIRSCPLKKRISSNLVLLSVTDGMYTHDKSKNSKLKPCRLIVQGREETKTGLKWSSKRSIANWVKFFSNKERINNRVEPRTSIVEIKEEDFIPKCLSRQPYICPFLEQVNS